MSELQVSLMTDEDPPVIAADTFQGKHSSQNNIPIEPPSFAKVRDNESSGHLNGQEVRSVNSEDLAQISKLAEKVTTISVAEKDKTKSAVTKQ
jgi:hypothetical protein